DRDTHIHRRKMGAGISHSSDSFDIFNHPYLCCESFFTVTVTHTHTRTHTQAHSCSHSHTVALTMSHGNICICKGGTVLLERHDPTAPTLSLMISSADT